MKTPMSLIIILLFLTSMIPSEAAGVAGELPTNQLYGIGSSSDDLYGPNPTYVYTEKAHKSETWNEGILRQVDFETGLLVRDTDNPLAITSTRKVDIQTVVSVDPTISYYTNDPMTNAERVGIYKIKYVVTATDPFGYKFDIASGNNWEFRSEDATWAGTYKDISSSGHTIQYGADHIHASKGNPYTLNENTENLITGAQWLAGKIPTYGPLVSGGIELYKTYNSFKSQQYDESMWQTGDFQDETNEEVSGWMRVPLNDYNDVSNDYAFDTVAFTIPLDVTGWGINGYYILHVKTIVETRMYQSSQWNSYPFDAWSASGWDHFTEDTQDIGIAIGGSNSYMINGRGSTGGSVSSGSLTDAWNTNIGNQENWTFLRGSTSEVTLSANPSSGYEFDKWVNADGGTITSGGSISVNGGTLTIAGVDSFTASPNDKLYIFEAKFKLLPPPRDFTFENKVWQKEIRGRTSTNAIDYYESQKGSITWNTANNELTVLEKASTYNRYVGVSTQFVSTGANFEITLDAKVSAGHSSPRKMYASINVKDGSGNFDRVGGVQLITSSSSYATKTLTFTGLSNGGTYQLFLFYNDAWSYDWNTKIFFKNLSYRSINLAPNTPSRPSGPTSVYQYETNRWSFYTTDTDSTSITFQIDWGDGRTTTVSATAGQWKSVYHGYGGTGTKYIKVRASSSGSGWSSWSSSLAVYVRSGGGGPVPIPVF